MELVVDHRENSYIIDQLRLWESFSYHDFDIQVRELEVGDYLCGSCIIEHKSLYDFIKSVDSGLIFKQTQDLLYNIDLNPYILISARIKDFEDKGFDRWSIYAIIASLNVRGVPTMIVDSEDLLIVCMLNLMKKHNDNKDRTNVNPARKPVSLDDQMQLTYSTLPMVGNILSGKLKDSYPTIEKLSQASIQQLMSIDGISKKKARAIFNYIHGL